MAGDVHNTNKIIIGLESIIFIISLIFIILHKVGGIYITWITPISWLVFLLTIGYFIIKLIQNLNN